MMDFTRYRVIRSIADSSLIPKDFLIVWEGKSVPAGWEELLELHDSLVESLKYHHEQAAKNPNYHLVYY